MESVQELTPESETEAGKNQAGKTEFPDSEMLKNLQNNTSLDKLPADLRDEIREILTYMDQLLESLPEDKIQEFARSEHFEVYKKDF